MKVMITGAKGQLGCDLAKLLVQTDEVFVYDKQQLNVTDAEQTMAVISNVKPDTIIHCAAYTLVDKAESDPMTAFAINAVGTRNVAVAAAQCNAKLVYISSDYVFSGNKRSSYSEFDEPAPINVYGNSKLHGEQFVRMVHNKFFIVRTSWLYSRGSNNFVGKILSAVQSGKPLRVIDDEVGSPTFTEDLAAFITSLIRTNRYGIYHASNMGCCSRYAFAQEILALCGCGDVGMQPISGAEFVTAAKRPIYSVLDHQMIRLNGFPEMPEWKHALARCLRGKEIVEEGNDPCVLLEREEA